MENILQESGLSRVLHHMENHDVGTISASRSVYNSSENKKRSSSLKAKLLSKGYGVTEVDGVYVEDYGTSEAIEVKEISFFVVDLKDKGKLKKDLQELGEEFDQDSILFIPKGGDSSILIGTNYSAEYPGYGKSVVFSHKGMGKEGEFMTKVKGRPFIFESFIKESLPPDTNMGRWGVSSFAKKHWSEFE